LNEAQARANSVNLDLDSQDLTVATDIARDVRERDGGLPCAKALGLYLDAPRPRPGVRGSN
jgi:glutamate formiminotransferase